MLRLFGALAVAMALWGLYAYVKSIGTTEAQQVCKIAHDAREKEIADERLVELEAARTKEHTLIATNTRIRNDYLKEKTAHDIAAARLNDSLQQLEDLTASLEPARASSDPSAGCGDHDDPRLCIIAQCSGALVRMDDAIKKLANQTRSLQEFAGRVCVGDK